MKSYVSKKMADLPVSGIRVIFEKAASMKDVIRLEVGEPDMDTPVHIREAAKRALDEGFTHYTSFNGIQELREAIAEKVKAENGIDADPARQIIVTPGASSSLYCGTMSIVNPGEKVLIPDPGWPHYDACVRMAGGITERYPLLERNDFRPDLADLANRVDKKTKALLINSPSNPTGAVFTRKDIEGIAEIAIENDLIVLSDEVYEKITYDNAEHISIASLPGMSGRTITINALSKTYAMTGWRIGYTVAPEEIVNQMAKLVLYTGTCANSIGQKAAVAALKGQQDSVYDMRREYKLRRDFLVKRLNEIEGMFCKLPEGAFYVFPNVESYGMASTDCAMYLLEQGRVSTVPGTGFGECGEGHLRLSYAASLESLEKGVHRIQEALRMKSKK